MDTNQLLLSRYVYHLFSILLIVGFFFTAAADAQAQNYVRAQVVSINNNTAQLTGGLTVQFDDVEISSQIGSPTLNDLTPGTWLTMEEGQYLAADSSAANTVFRAQRIYVERLQDLLVSGAIEKVDTTRNSITVLGKEILFDAETKLLKKKKKKNKFLTINDLAPGMIVSVESILIDGNITARKLVMGFSGFGPQPTVVGFATKVNDRIVETTGGFLIDLTDFPLFGVDLVPGMRTSFNIRDTSVVPFKVNGAGVHMPGISFNSTLEAVDAANKTIPVAKRTFTVTEDTVFSNILDFSDFEVGKQIYLSFNEVNGQLILGGVSQ